MSFTSAITEFYLSQELNKPIIDYENKKVAHLRDIAVCWDKKVPIGRGIKFLKDSNKLININHIKEWTKDAIVLATSLEKAADIVARDEDIYIVKWFLDKQLIDLKGKKLVRVNDIKISFYSKDLEKKLILLAIDVGFSGILRRLGIKFLESKIQPQLISWNYLAPIKKRTSNLQLATEFEGLKDLHPADIADIIEELSQPDREKIIESLDIESAAEVLAEADIETQVNVIDSLDAERAADILEEMPSDDAADILSELDEEKSQEILEHMDPEEANEVIELMNYEDEDVGSLMTKDYITLTGDETSEEALNKIKKMAEEVETIYVSYVVDSEEKLIGVVSLRELLIAKPDEKIKDIMQKNVISLNHFDHHDKALEMFAKYNLFTMPVIDNENRLLGIITVDDVLRLLMPDRSDTDTFSRFDSLKKFLREGGE
ncbi:MgtE intracellular region [Thermodesulfobium narugense DSM 14796]|uniref:MgtE intracellular region n=1 Tax=Thermodesulfobium narugense DSM 14796 TaxID=747365 RepID=M1E9I2_9BACT|nr:CBS domain-containing protein [Thermodesulfobium narugense]AEE15324.1 MgtE intracellular region [Thermodesulfobium narugense DSM 14796]